MTPSEQQRRWYWVALMKPIADATDGGFTPEELHAAMKQRYLDGRSTTEPSRAEFSEYCAAIVRWAEGLGVKYRMPIPDKSTDAPTSDAKLEAVIETLQRYAECRHGSTNCFCTMEARRTLALLGRLR